MAITHVMSYKIKQSHALFHEISILLVPDLSLLEADLVKFLAQQRLQQLLTTDSRQTVGELVSSPSHVPSTAGTEDVLSRQPPAGFTSVVYLYLLLTGGFLFVRRVDKMPCCSLSFRVSR